MPPSIGGFIDRLKENGAIYRIADPGRVEPDRVNPDPDPDPNLERKKTGYKSDHTDQNQNRHDSVLRKTNQIRIRPKQIHP